MAQLVPYLVFADADASLAFLREALGFETTAEQRDDQGGVVHAELRLGEAVVMGGTATPAQLDERPWDAPAGRGLYLVVDDVDAVHERALAQGAESVYGPQDTEWGTRRARVRDLDGYEWSFGTYRPGGSW